MRIRLAGEADKQAINILRQQVQSVHAAGRPDFFPAEFSRELADHLNIFFMQDNAEVIVTEVDDQLVGFASIEYIDRPGSPYRLPVRYCHVVEFGVEERHRRQGIGTALFENIKERAKEKGVDRIELDMWEFNESALRFYESLGFRTFRRYMEFRTMEE